MPELRDAHRLLGRADDSSRPWLVMAIAQYHREMEKDPVAGLRILAPEVLGDAAAETWNQALIAAERNRRSRWQQERIDAHRERREAPEEPSGLALNLPPVSAFRVTYATAPAALETARCLMALGKINEALQIIDRFGREFQGDDGMVLAYECLGDLQQRQQLFEPAIGSYRTGVRALDALKPTEGFSDWQSLTRKRLNDKLAEARRQFDIARYGAGWVAYRKAEALRLQDKNYLEAILAYDHILETSPNSVWSEAARAYKVKSLLELARLPERDPQTRRREPGPRERRIIAAAEAAVTNEKAFLALARRSRVPRASLDLVQSRIAAAEAYVAALKASPHAGAALEAARDIVRSSLRENQWGLYRGEMLVDLGDFYLEYVIDAAKAGEYYGKAVLWFDNVRSIDRSIELATLPEQARPVATPPQKERRVDNWGNIVLQTPQTGQLFNRRTAPWYWSMHRKHLALRVGLLAFVKRDYETAREEWSHLLKIDPFFAWSEKNHRGSTLNRLMWNLKHNDGCLYATPAEMRAFQNPQRRLLVFLADLAYESEDREAALAIYNRLLAGENGKTSRAETAYLLYAKFACLAWLGKPGDDVRFLSRHVNDLRGTPSEARALLGLANRTLAQGGDQGRTAALHWFEELRRRAPNSQEARDSLFLSAWIYLKQQSWDSAIRSLNGYLRRQQTGGYARFAQQILATLLSDEFKQNQTMGK